uniref:Tetratricopeptide repeat protein n=1 Tax=Coralloluteibacterium stylophorae TaxID=1776034 RepID=A0A8J8AZA9_9GAMM
MHGQAALQHRVEAERLAAGQPAWPRRLGAGFGYENWDRYKADSNLALARSLAGDTAGAEASLRALARIAPSNASLQAALGGVLQQRGRAAAALERYDGALTLDPRTRGARLGRVGALTALQRHAEARRALAEVTARYRRDPQVARAEREFARSRGWQFELGASGGRSDARDGGTSASPLGAEDAALQVELASPLLADRWRVTASALARRADFDGARTRYRSAGVGIDYVHDRLHVAASAAHVLDADGGGPALRVAADWRVSDAWLGYAEARTRDPDGSMQARRLGIGADSVRAGLRFSRDDTLVVDARLGQLRYEDGNRREQFGLDASALVARRPHLRIDLLGAGYASRGRDRDVSYFNPRRDASAQLGLRIDHLGWRRYEREFRQRLEIGAGPYWQEGHGTHWVPTVAYRHAWRLGLGRVLDYGAAWSRPVYDGAREQRIMFDLGYRWGQP